MEPRWATERLTVAPWHDVTIDTLTEFLTELLTPAVTAALPPGWLPDGDPEWLLEWIGGRDRESTPLLVSASSGPIGLLIVATASDTGPPAALRIGYLLQQSHWGRGFATELVTGFVDRCRADPDVRSVAGGVQLDQVASARVLERAGLVRHGPPDGTEQTYRIVFPAPRSLLTRPETPSDASAGH